MRTRLTAPGARIGLLGGSFNPAHEGHLRISRLALARLRLDQVWWLVSPGNPLKDEKTLAAYEARRAAAARLARDPRIVATGIERRLGTRYTIDTLRALKRRHPKLHFVWLMGGDNLADMTRWKDWRGIFREMPIAVIARPGYTHAARASVAAHVFAKYRRTPREAGRLAALRPPAWLLLEAWLHPASATALREQGLWPAPTAS